MDPDLQEHLGRVWGWRPVEPPAEPDAAARLREVTAWIRDAEREAAAAVRAAGLGPAPPLEVVHGNGAANGHAARVRGEAVAWVSTECFADRLSVRVFVLHEVLHAVHDRLNPGRAPERRADVVDPLRLAVVEGCATHLTAALGGFGPMDALWGGGLPPAARRRWAAQARRGLPALARAVLREWEQPGAPSDLYFYRPDEPPVRNRGGYLVSALAVKRAVKADPTLTPRRLLGLPPEDLRGRMVEGLRRLAGRR